MKTHENELRLLRDKELANAYKRILKEEFDNGNKIDRRKIITRLLNEYRPLFHVSFEHAYKVLSTIRNHGTKVFKCTLRQQMWNELLSLVENELKNRPYLNLSTALSRVLASQRASRFYITPEYCYKYLYKIA